MGHRLAVFGSWREFTRECCEGMCFLITGALKSQVDRVWDAFWSGGISNPFSVVEQITYLLFARRLDELHTAKEA